MNAVLNQIQLSKLLKLYQRLSPFLQQHSKNVAIYSELLARATWESDIYRDDPHFSQEAAESIGRCAYWHDIGKAEISHRLWDMRRGLTAQEFALAQKHTVLGAAIIAERFKLTDRSTPNNLLVELTKNCCLFHHERWDGDGYPSGRCGLDIPIESRIVAIADAYDSMTSTRPYCPPRSPEWALAELERCAASQFDPLLVPIFIDLMSARESMAVPG